MGQRIILHIDMDSFFASVEERENPDIRGKPVIVGSDPKGGKGRGVVSTCNYEARKYGIGSATPISKAYRLCPHGVYLRPTFSKYKDVSVRIMKLLEKYADVMSQVSIDEAYLDISSRVDCFEDSRIYACHIKKEIFETEGLTCSIGVGPNKLVAKICSEYDKPDGLCVVSQQNIKDFLGDLPIQQIPGIGRKTTARLHALDIFYGRDLQRFSVQRLIDLFGRTYGPWLFRRAHGIDTKEVNTLYVRKSIGKERTFFEDTSDSLFLMNKIEGICEDLRFFLEKHAYVFRTITLKVRFADFTTYTRSKTLPWFVSDTVWVSRVAVDLFREFDTSKKLRLIGVRLSNLRVEHYRQISLMDYFF